MAHPIFAAGAAASSFHRAEIRRYHAAKGKDDRSHRPLDDRDRQTLRSPPLRRFAEAMDRRADIRMDQLECHLARDFERFATTVAAFIRLATIRLMLKRLTRPSHCS
jgi:hypothetical protein